VSVFASRFLPALRRRGVGCSFVPTVALVIVAVVFLAPAARAQPGPPPAPFSKIALHAGGNIPVSAGALGTFYRVSPGVDVGFSTPFYAGTAGVNVGLRQIRAREGRAESDLWAVPTTLHWGTAGLGSDRLRPAGSVRLGSLVMHFQGGGAGRRTESELLMGAEAGLSLRLDERWRLTAHVQYERVLTSTPFSLWQVRAGVRRRFDAPQWFQTLLR
jgi:hypothetical protein